MANTNYPQELVALVEEYLTDGIISAKERQVLLKKAQQLGVDVDEFDLYIDAQQQKVDQAVDAAAAKKRGKTCPFCGGTVPQLTDKCPHCGETVTPEASEELQEIFDHLEEALVDFKSGKDIEKSKAIVERYVRKAKMYYENNPKVQKLLAEVQEESETASASAKKNARNKAIGNAFSKTGSGFGSIFSFLLNHLFAFLKTKAGIITVVALIIIGSLWWLIVKVNHDNAEDSLRHHIERVTNVHERSHSYKLLSELVVPEWLSDKGAQKIAEKYDAVHLAVINKYLEPLSTDTIEMVGLMLRAKIGDDEVWHNTSTYKQTKSKFQSLKIDSSAIE